MMADEARDIYETGNEPDYTVDDISRVEYLRDGSIRLFLAAEWRGGLRTEYSARVTSPEKLAEFARALMVIADGILRTEEDRRVVAH